MHARAFIALDDRLAAELNDDAVADLLEDVDTLGATAVTDVLVRRTVEALALFLRHRNDLFGLDLLLGCLVVGWRRTLVDRSDHGLLRLIATLPGILATILLIAVLLAVLVAVLAATSLAFGILLAVGYNYLHRNKFDRLTDKAASEVKERL